MRKLILKIGQAQLLVFAVILFMLSSCQQSGKIDYDTSLIPFYDGSKWGYVDKEGKYVINPQFDDAYYFFEDRAVVKMEDKYGYIDKSGKYVINPVYKDALCFRDGYAYTIMPNERIKVIDKNGKVVKEIKEEYVHQMPGDYFVCIDDNNKYELIEPNGTKSKVNFGSYIINSSNGKYCVVATEDFKKWGVTDINGKVVIKLEYDLIWISGDYVMFGKNEKYGIMNMNGEILVNPQFERLLYIGDGLFAVRLNDSKVWGICDEKGKMQVNPQFEALGEIGEYGLIPVKMNNKWGYVDKQGKIVINPQFDSANNFAGGYAIVEDKNYGLIDKEGKYIVNPQFKSIQKNPNNTRFFIRSDFTDISGAANKIKALIAENSIFGVNPNSSISSILSSVGLSEDKLSRYGISTTIKKSELMKDVNAELSVRGDFFKAVSDGWWSYKYVLMGDAVPSDFYLKISFGGKFSGKYNDVLKALNNNKEVDCDAIVINGVSCGVNTNYNEIYISINK